MRMPITEETNAKKARKKTIKKKSCNKKKRRARKKPRTRRREMKEPKSLKIHTQESPSTLRKSSV